MPQAGMSPSLVLASPVPIRNRSPASDGLPSPVQVAGSGDCCSWLSERLRPRVQQFPASLRRTCVAWKCVASTRLHPTSFAEPPGAHDHEGDPAPSHYSEDAQSVFCLSVLCQFLEPRCIHDSRSRSAIPFEFEAHMYDAVY